MRKGMRWRFAAAALLLGWSLTGCARSGAAAPPGPPEEIEIGGLALDLEDRGDHVFVRANGKATVGASVRSVRRIFQYSRANGRDLVLVDAAGADFSGLTVAECIVGMFGLLPVWDYGSKMAIVMPDESASEFLTGASIPAGKLKLLKVGRYNNIEAAEAWLFATR